MINYHKNDDDDDFQWDKSIEDWIILNLECIKSQFN